MEIKELIGETLKYIDIDESNNEIMLTTERGRIIRIYHSQDCCESVRIVDIQGNPKDLVGKVVVSTGEEIEIDINPPDVECYDCCTRTNLTFRVDGATLITKWIGESNGHYSESVDIEDVTQERR